MSYTYTKESDTLSAIIHLVGGMVTGELDGSDINYVDGQTPPTQEEIDTQLIKMQEEYDSQVYIQKRQPLYPDIVDCVHALLDGGETLTALQEKRQAVKIKFPKEQT